MKKTVKSYSSFIVAVPDIRLQGTAFFPAGHGVYKENNETIKSHYPIMVVGQDYDNEENFYKVQKLPNQSELDNKNTTWRNLIKILGEDIVKKSFFTNAIMGLRVGSTKNTGVSVAFKKGNENFLQENIDFFKEQVRIVKPSVIICLGAQMPKFIGKCFPAVFPDLSKINSFKQLDASEFKDQNELLLDDKSIKIIFITHPSLYYVNASKRMGGIEFERELIGGLLNPLGN
ncbi:MAG: uracil-DNA glycosylase family protein [Candidatus Methylacidiphilales bacterium]